jgi:hypothetical protein
MISEDGTQIVAGYVAQFVVAFCQSAQLKILNLGEIKEENLYFLLFNRVRQFRVSFSQMRNFLLVVLDTVIRVDIAADPLKVVFRLFRHQPDS